MVEYIEYMDKKLPVRISYGVLLAISEYNDVSMDDIAKGNIKDLKMFEKIAFVSLKSGHRAIGKEFTMKEEEMFDFLEDCFLQFLALFPKFFPTEGDIKKQEPQLGNRQQRRSGTMGVIPKETGLQNK